jgi:3-oxoacyl-[acyl-carrier protein] reductase
MIDLKGKNAFDTGSSRGVGQQIAKGLAMRGSNVFAVYTLCSAFLPAMIENGFGRVINITSGIKDQPELAPYGASKWAVNKITDDFAIKLDKTGVRINMLDPGWLRTDLGGEDAEHPVEAVLPGALAPALIDDDGANGKFFSAIDHDL